MNQDIVNKMDELIQQIECHRRRYYVEDDPVISDGEYDALERELLEMEKNHSDLIRPDSPSFRVGGGVAGDHPERAHRTPMLSLENAYDREGLLRFIERTVDAAGRELKYSAELKIDGVSLSVIYEEGLLRRAVTRGDGRAGEDVTLNAKTIKDLPLRVPEWQTHAEMEVRGEVYLDKRGFGRLNESRLDEDLPLFANPRNAAAGSLRILDAREAARRGLRMFIYQVIGPWTARFNSHMGSLEALKALGFPVNPHNRGLSGADAFFSLIQEWSEMRRGLDYDTDGVVFKVDDPSFYEEIGYTAKFPKWATAYKFPAERATTRIREVDVQVGRTGVLTPVALLEPVALAGTTVSRATLHNFDEIGKKDIREGDWVFIEKGGDIIPKVVKVIEEKRGGEEKVIAVPDRCPRCGEATIKVEGQVAVRCVNLACPAQLERRIAHFASRKAMDIQGLGKERVRQMVAQGLLTDLVSIFRLDAHKLWQLERVGDKWIANLLAEIEKAKQRPFARLLFAVGIPMIGEKVAEILAAHFAGHQRLVRAETEEIAAIHGMGEKVAQSLYDHLRLESYHETFRALGELGLKLEVDPAERVAEDAPQPLAGKTVVVTGSFDQWTRVEITRKLKALGANVTGSVTSKTDYLLAGQKAGSKLAKAESLGVEIVDQDWVKPWLDP